MRRLTWSLTGILALSSLHSQAAPPRVDRRPIIFLLDASGSMLEMFQGVPRMVAARVMLEEQLSRLPPGIPTGLVAFGNGIEGCDSVRLYVPVANGNRHTIARAVNKINPGGNTPLGRALQLIRESLLPNHPGARIVVISDGAESCGGDPTGQALALKASGSAVELNILGLGVAAAEAEQLRRVAEAAGGRYFQVDEHSDFEKAMQESLRPAPSRPPEKADPEISTPETAVPETPAPELEKKGALQLHNPRIIEENNKSYLVFDYTTDTPAESFARFYIGRRGTSAAEIRNAPQAVLGSPAAGGGKQGGMIRWEIPSGQSREQPIYVLGELWNIDRVPEILGYSSVLPIQ
ncbi:MAG: VWA domain-containing protein [Spirochaetales bacterium]|nr:VWA domain-containing protein [Spirochaetales bacterium]